MPASGFPQSTKSSTCSEQSLTPLYVGLSGQRAHQAAPLPCKGTLPLLQIQKSRNIHLPPGHRCTLTKLTVSGVLQAR